MGRIPPHTFPEQAVKLNVVGQPCHVFMYYPSHQCLCHGCFQTHTQAEASVVLMCGAYLWFTHTQANSDTVYSCSSSGNVLTAACRLKTHICHIWLPLCPCFISSAHPSIHLHVPPIFSVTKRLRSRSESSVLLLKSRNRQQMCVSSDEVHARWRTLCSAVEM